MSGSRPARRDSVVKIGVYNAPLAQLVEQLPFKQTVVGSNPTRGTKKIRFGGFLFYLFFYLHLLHRHGRHPDIV